LSYGVKLSHYYFDLTFFVRTFLLDAYPPADKIDYIIPIL